MTVSPGKMPGPDRDFDRLQPGSKVQRSMTMSSDEHGRTSLTKSIAGALFAVTVLEVVIAVVGAALTGSTLDEALNSYLVTNSAIGLSCAASGVLIAWHRPRNGRCGPAPRQAVSSPRVRGHHRPHGPTRKKT